MHGCRAIKDAQGWQTQELSVPDGLVSQPMNRAHFLDVVNIVHLGAMYICIKSSSQRKEALLSRESRIQ